MSMFYNWRVIVPDVMWCWAARKALRGRRIERTRGAHLYSVRSIVVKYFVLDTRTSKCMKGPTTLSFATRDIIKEVETICDRRQALYCDCR
jgi:hypothetical protein